MLRSLVTVCFLFFFTFLSAQELYHRATIHLDGAEDRARLEQLGLALDHGAHKGTVGFTSDFSAQDLARARAAGFGVSVLIKDVGQYYRDQNDPTSPRYVATPKNEDCSTEASSIVTPANYHGGSMGGFLTYAELLTELDEMYAYCQANNLDIMTPRADNKNPTDPEDLKTFEGRYQQWVKISDNAATEEDEEPQVLYTALHHAREPASMQQLVFYLWYLIENYQSDPRVKAIVDNTELYFIPCLNPDGYLYNETTNPDGGGFWRKNRREGYGVDLNRNYSYITPEGEEVWGGAGTSTDLASDVYAGTGPFSEPETRAVRYFVETHRFGMALNNHTHGELLLYPFGYDLDKPTPDHDLFGHLTDAMVRDNDYNNMISSGLYPAAGDSDDFMYAMLTTAAGGTRDKVLALTPEIGYAFWPAEADIEGICREMVETNLSAASVLGVFGLVEAELPTEVTTTEIALPLSVTRYGLKEGDLNLRFQPVSANFETAAYTEVVASGALGVATPMTLELNLVDDVTPGENIVFELGIGAGTALTTQRYTLSFGNRVPILTDPATSIGPWVVAGQWNVAPGIHPDGAPNASLTDSPGGNYEDESTTTITRREAVDLSATDLTDASLQFYARWLIEEGYDQVQLQVSTDGGVSWVPQCGLYTKTGTSDQAGAGEPLYDGSQEEWVREEISLSEYLGQELLFRFELTSDRNVNADGFYFTDFTVGVRRQGATGTREKLTAPLTVYPNPAGDWLTINTELTDYEYSLHDALGRVLRQGRSLQGTQRLDLLGLAKGFYFLRVRQAGKERTVKVVRE